MLKEFKEFIMKGNVVDLAVAVIIGAAFGAIVKSLTEDIVMPLIGIILGGLDFQSLSVQVGKATLKYGNFIQTIVFFLIIAFVMFLVVKAINAAKKKPAPAAPAGPTTEEKLLTEIRDLLRKR